MNLVVHKNCMIKYKKFKIGYFCICSITACETPVKENPPS